MTIPTAAHAPFGECHAHFAMDGVNYAQGMARHKDGPSEAHIRACFEAYRKCDIAFVRDGGDKYGVSARAKRIAPEYGIDYRTPLFAIHREGVYGGIVGRGFATMDEYATLVEEACAAGADFIKIMTTGIMDFNEYGRIMYGSGLPAEEVREMVHIAHACGRAVMAHTNGARAIQVAAEAGVDSVEHGNYLDDAAIAALAEHGTCLVPTMAVAHNLRRSGLYNEASIERICTMEREGVHAAWEAGVTIACGSDAGAVRVPHGQGTLDEYACLVEAIGSKDAAGEALARGQDYIERTFMPW
ncbi:MAG: amidohydrolase family protein [Eggerthellaceae bacterium]|nr:amidohydrolase family protein [Eggerthellaceae bacterium]